LLSVQEYEEMHNEWHRNVDNAIKHIQKAKELIEKIPPSILSAISVWGEKGIKIKNEKIVNLDIVGHASFRERCLIIYRLLVAIIKELGEDVSI
jgi:hypothetical protein